MASAALLQTEVLIAYIKKDDEDPLLEAYQEYFGDGNPGMKPAVSAVTIGLTIAAIEAANLNTDHREELRRRLRSFRRILKTSGDLYPFDWESAEDYAGVRNTCRNSGIVLAAEYQLEYSIALTNGLVILAPTLQQTKYPQFPYLQVDYL